MIACLFQGAAHAASKPHFVIVMTDDQSFREFDRTIMPKTFRAIADKGAMLTNAWFNVALCCPARANFLTGKYAQNTGVSANSYAQFLAGGNEPQTFAAVLAKAGYVNIMSGKHLNGYNGYLNGRFHLPEGWTYWTARVGGANIYTDSTVINEAGKRTKVQEYTTDYYFDQAVIDVAAALRTGQPTLTFVNVSAPHTPYIPPARYKGACNNVPLPRIPSYNHKDPLKPAYTVIGKFNQTFEAKLNQSRRDRICSLRSVDDGVEKLVQAYEQAGQGNNTYFIFMSDNGMLMGEHGLTNSKGSPHQESLRMFLAIRGPGIRPRSEIGQLIGIADLAPTMYELAGVATPAWVDGRSIVSVWGPKPPSAAAWRKVLPGQLITSGSTPRIPSWRGVVTAKGQTYAEYAGLKGKGVWQEFYDRNLDAYELSNRANRQPSWLLTRFAYLTKQLNTCAGATCREREQSYVPASR
ncbi:MAG: sulfatase-like hydrolase/transferase [Geminicoccaceae bacterium]|nr:sulfatase-like hydrolase/transferase [Geminicoccaceae bacterium]